MQTPTLPPEGFLDTAVGITQVVAPWLPFAGVIVGGILLGIFNTHNRRKGNVETRAPDVNEAWEEARTASHELDAERRLRRRLQNYSWELLYVFRMYVKRVRAGGSTDMTAHEQLFYDSDTPTDEVNVKNP